MITRNILPVLALFVILFIDFSQGRRFFQGAIANLLSTTVRGSGENNTDVPHYSSKNAWVSGSSRLPFETQEQQPYSSSLPADSTTSSSEQSFQVLRRMNQQKVQSYLRGIKLFNKFKFKGFAITLIKSVTEWNAAGIGVKIPITPNFPNYDSIIYLPRIVATLSLNYPYCWKLGFTINVPLQVYVMLVAIGFEYANQIYQVLKKYNLLKSSSQEHDDHSQQGEEEEEDHMLSSFSDRDIAPRNQMNSPQAAAASSSSSSTSSSSSSSSGSSSSSTSTSPVSAPAKKPAVKASGSVKRIGVTIGYKYTAWKAKGNGWSMGPAFNYVSSLVITNKLLPMMILISVCFFSMVETAFLLMYWMYEIYYFFVHQLLMMMHTFTESLTPTEMMFPPATTTATPNTASSSGSSTPAYYYSSDSYPYPAHPSLLSPTRPPRILQTAGGGNSSPIIQEEMNYFINSNNDLSIFSDYEDYFTGTPPESIPTDYPTATSSYNTLPTSETTQTTPGATIEPQKVEEDQKPKKLKLSTLVQSLQQRYHQYAQHKLQTQLLYSTAKTASTTSSSLWQINWRRIEKWMLTKSPIFGYSVSTSLLPWPSKGMKISTNVNFDIQNFHPMDNLQKLLDSIDFEKNAETCMSKNTFS